jgi:hypothetical protein
MSRGLRVESTISPAGSRRQTRIIYLCQLAREPNWSIEILNDKNIYPDEATLAKLFVITARDPATQRVINRLWTRVKTGR